MKRRVKPGPLEYVGQLAAQPAADLRAPQQRQHQRQRVQQQPRVGIGSETQVRAHHEEHTVRKVEHVHEAKDERETRRHQEIECAQRQPRKDDAGHHLGFIAVRHPDEDGQHNRQRHQERAVPAHGCNHHAAPCSAACAGSATAAA